MVVLDKAGEILVELRLVDQIFDQESHFLVFQGPVPRNSSLIALNSNRRLRCRQSITAPLGKHHYIWFGLSEDSWINKGKRLFNKAKEMVLPKPSTDYSILSQYVLSSKSLLLEMGGPEIEQTLVRLKIAKDWVVPILDDIPSIKIVELILVDSPSLSLDVATALVWILGQPNQYYKDVSVLPTSLELDPDLLQKLLSCFCGMETFLNEFKAKSKDQDFRSFRRGFSAAIKQALHFRVFFPFLVVDELQSLYLLQEILDSYNPQNFAEDFPSLLESFSSESIKRIGSSLFTKDVLNKAENIPHLLQFSCLLAERGPTILDMKSFSSQLERLIDKRPQEIPKAFSCCTLPQLLPTIQGCVYRRITSLSMPVITDILGNLSTAQINLDLLDRLLKSPLNSVSKEAQFMFLREFLPRLPKSPDPTRLLLSWFTKSFPVFYRSNLRDLLNFCCEFEDFIDLPANELNYRRSLKTVIPRCLQGKLSKDQLGCLIDLPLASDELVCQEISLFLGEKLNGVSSFFRRDLSEFLLSVFSLIQQSVELWGNPAKILVDLLLSFWKRNMPYSATLAILSNDFTLMFLQNINFFPHPFPSYFDKFRSFHPFDLPVVELKEVLPYRKNVPHLRELFALCGNGDAMDHLDHAQSCWDRIQREIELYEIFCQISEEFHAIDVSLLSSKISANILECSLASLTSHDFFPFSKEILGLKTTAHALQMICSLRIFKALLDAQIQLQPPAFEPTCQWIALHAIPNASKQWERYRKSLSDGSLKCSDALLLFCNSPSEVGRNQDIEFIFSTTLSQSNKIPWNQVDKVKKNIRLLFHLSQYSQLLAAVEALPNLLGFSAQDALDLSSRSSIPTSRLQSLKQVVQEQQERSLSELKQLETPIKQILKPLTLEDEPGSNACQCLLVLVQCSHLLDHLRLYRDPMIYDNLLEIADDDMSYQAIGLVQKCFNLTHNLFSAIDAKSTITLQDILLHIYQMASSSPSAPCDLKQTDFFIHSGTIQSLFDNLDDDSTMRAEKELKRIMSFPPGSVQFQIRISSDLIKHGHKSKNTLCLKDPHDDILYNAQGLCDLRNRLVLAARSTNETNLDTLVKEFIQVVDIAERLDWLHLQLHLVGLFDFYDKRSTYPLDSPHKLIDAENQLKKMYISWEHHLNSVSQKFPYLNFFSLSQLREISEYLECGLLSSRLSSLLLSFLHLSSISNTTFKHATSSFRRSQEKIQDPQPHQSQDLTFLGEFLNRIVEVCQLAPIRHLDPLLLGLGKDRLVALQSGIPNVIESDNDIWKTVLTLFLDRGHIPEPFELLVCTSETSAYAVRSLFLRWHLETKHNLRDIPPLYCLANTQELSADVQAEIVEWISREELLDFLSSPACLVIVTRKGDDCSRLLVDFLQQFHTASPALSPEQIRKAYRYITMNNTDERGVVVVRSALGMFGKTHYIHQEAGENLHVISLSGNVSANDLVKKLSSIKHSSGLSIHFNIADNVEPTQLDPFLFQLFVIGLLVSHDGNRWCSIRSLRARFFIEIPNIVREKGGDLVGHVCPMLPSHYIRNWSDIQISPDDFMFSAVAKLLALPDDRFCGENLRQHLPQFPLPPDPLDSIKRHLTPLENPTFMQVVIFVHILFRGFSVMLHSPFYELENLREYGPPGFQLRLLVRTCLVFMARSLAERSIDDASTQELVTIRSGKLWENSHFLMLMLQQGGSIIPVYGEEVKIPLEFHQMKCTLQEIMQTQDPSYIIPDLSKCSQKLLLTELIRVLDPPFSCATHSLQFIDGFAFTKDNVLKMMAIFSRVDAGLPVILMGDTGSGKTMSIRLLSKLLGCQFDSLDVDGGTEEATVVNFIKACIAQSDPTRKHWIFFDEVNTAKCIWLFKEILIDRRFFGVPIPTNFLTLAACNPYKIRQDATNHNTLLFNYSSEIDNLSRLVYRVHPLPVSLLDLCWHWGGLTREDELCYIQAMLEGKGILQKKNVFADILGICHNFIHSNCQHDPALIVTMRDVVRWIPVFTWLSTTLLPQIPNPDCSVEIRSLLHSVSICYVCRLSVELRRALQDEISQRLHISPDFIEKIIFDDRKAFADRLVSPENPKVAKNEAILENLFVLAVCIFNRLHAILVGKPGSSKSLAVRILVDNFRISCSGQKGLPFKLPPIHFRTYQCSPLSTSETIKAEYERMIAFQERNQNIHEKGAVMLLLLEEIGLAEHSPHMPLKVLHTILHDSHSPISIIGLSNWQLDPAKQNRAIFLNRSLPTETDLVLTAQALLTGHQSRLVESHLPQLAAAYSELIQCNEPLPDFFGLRDFYFMIQFINSHLLKKFRKSFSHICAMAVARNFGGSPDGDCLSQQIFRKHLTINDVITSENSFHNKTLQLIEDNLNDPTSRHLMIISPDENGLLGILQEHCLLNDVELFIGSDFIDDNSEAAVCSNITRIRNAMEAGRKICLMRMDNLYESLYDVLNMHYTQMGEKNYCTLAIGAERKKCCISTKFKSIVIMSSDKVYGGQVPPPMLNRFEKQVLSHKDLLNTRGKDISQEVMRWVAYHPNVHGDPRELDLDTNPFCIRRTFVGFLSNNVRAMVVHELKTDPQRSDSEIIESCQKSLLWTATPEGVLSHSTHSKDVQVMQAYFWGEQQHDSLERLLQQFPETQRFCIFTFSSPVFSLVHLFHGICKPESIQLIDLLYFSREQFFRDCFRKALNLDSCECILIQCKLQGSTSRGFSYSRAMSIVTHAKYIVTQELNCLIRVSSPPKVIFVVHLLTELLPKFAFHFDPSWYAVTIADIEAGTRNADHLFHIPILGDLLLVGEEPSQLLCNQQVFDLHLCLHLELRWALAQIRFPQHATFRSERQIQLIQKLFDDVAFFTILKEKIIQVAHSKAQLPSFRATNWLQETARNSEFISRYGSLRRALAKKLLQLIHSSFGDVLALLDRNFNLHSYEFSSKHLRDIFLNLFSHCRFSMRTNSNDVVPSEGFHEPFLPLFPFSFILKHALPPYQQMSKSGDNLAGIPPAIIANLLDQPFHPDELRVFIHDLAFMLTFPFINSGVDILCWFIFNDSDTPLSLIEVNQVILDHWPLLYALFSLLSALPEWEKLFYSDIINPVTSLVPRSFLISWLSGLIRSLASQCHLHQDSMLFFQLGTLFRELATELKDQNMLSLLDSTSVYQTFVKNVIWPLDSSTLNTPSMREFWDIIRLELVDQGSLSTPQFLESFLLKHAPQLFASLRKETAVNLAVDFLVHLIYENADVLHAHFLVPSHFQELILSLFCGPQKAYSSDFLLSFTQSLHFKDVLLRCVILGMQEGTAQGVLRDEFNFPPVFSHELTKFASVHSDVWPQLALLIIHFVEDQLWYQHPDPSLLPETSIGLLLKDFTRLTSLDISDQLITFGCCRYLCLASIKTGTWKEACSPLHVLLCSEISSPLRLLFFRGFLQTYGRKSLQNTLGNFANRPPWLTQVDVNQLNDESDPLSLSVCSCGHGKHFFELRRIFASPKQDQEKALNELLKSNHDIFQLATAVSSSLDSPVLQFRELFDSREKTILFDAIHSVRKISGAGERSFSKLQQSVIVDFGLAVNFLGAQGNASILYSLLRKASELSSSLIPTFPSDLNAMAARSLNSNGGVTLYQCINGHVYGVGECGRPVATAMCFCGQRIGGESHQLVHGSLPFHNSAAPPGYTYDPHEAANVSALERRLPPKYYRILRLIIHSLLVVYAGVDRSGCTIFLKQNNRTISHFLWERWIQDWNLLQQLLPSHGINADENLAVMLHLVAQQLRICTFGKEDFHSETERTRFEDSFVFQCLDPIFSNLRRKIYQARANSTVAGPLMSRILDEADDWKSEFPSFPWFSAKLAFPHRFDGPYTWESVSRACAATIRSTNQSPNPVESAPLLTLFARKMGNQSIIPLSLLPPILRWHFRVVSRFSGRLFHPQSSQNRTLSCREAIESASTLSERKEWTQDFDQFLGAWEELQHRLKTVRYDCQEVELSQWSLALDSPLLDSIATTETDSGNVVSLVVMHLVQTHNHFLEKALLAGLSSLHQDNTSCVGCDESVVWLLQWKMEIVWGKPKLVPTLSEAATFKFLQTKKVSSALKKEIEQVVIRKEKFGVETRWEKLHTFLDLLCKEVISLPPTLSTDTKVSTFLTQNQTLLKDLCRFLGRSESSLNDFSSDIPSGILQAEIGQLFDLFDFVEQKLEGDFDPNLLPESIKRLCSVELPPQERRKLVEQSKEIHHLNLLKYFKSFLKDSLQNSKNVIEELLDSDLMEYFSYQKKSQKADTFLDGLNLRCTFRHALDFLKCLQQASAEP